jgi:hypothetical protein
MSEENVHLVIANYVIRVEAYKKRRRHPEFGQEVTPNPRNDEVQTSDSDNIRGTTEGHAFIRSLCAHTCATR